MLRKTLISRAALAVIGGGLAISTNALMAQETVQRVEITGSAIKRTQAEGPAPIDIYTRKDIERSGATTISELVKNLSALDIDDQGELTGNSPSGSGTTNLQIRGLSERNVLVLLNGRRLPVNALHDGSGAGAAVDVNNIPLSAIEQVQVLKDGGSAIYGADAVAGVINFITRKNYSGLELRIGYGQSSRGDSKETPFGLVGGLGDYDNDGYNILAAVDYFKRDPLLRSDRDITRSADWRRFNGGNGLDGRSSFHPSGNLVGVDGLVFGQVVPCPPEDLNGTTCRFDFNKTILTSINGADRLSTMLIGNVKLGSNFRGFGEFTYSSSDDTFQSQPAPGVFFDADGNLVRGRFMQVGPRTTDRKSTLTQIVAGVEGTFGETEFSVEAGQGTSKVTNQDSNFLATDLFFAALDAGTIDPTSDANPTAALDALRITPLRTGKSVLRFVNAKVAGTLAQLGGGPLQYAAGLQANRETLSDRPDENQQNGNVFGSITQASVDASRRSEAVFGELSMPFFKGFESQLALRYDRYPGNSSTSPKVGVKYQPINEVAVRASYARSFLAPSLKQLFGGQEEGAASTSDPFICSFFPTLAGACDNFPYNEVSGSNPDLKPERGRTVNLGLILEPTPGLNMSVDYWAIDKKDEINTLSTESALEQGDFAVEGGEAFVFTTNKNVAATKVSGVDGDIRFRLGNTAAGDISVRNTTTYYISNETQFEQGGSFSQYIGTWLNPRWRNTFSATLDSGAWSTTAIIRSTGGFYDSNLPWGDFDVASTPKIGTHEELDLTVQYSGLTGLQLTGGVKNLLDRGMPYANTGTQNQYGSLGFPWIYSPRGRFFFVTAEYKFF
jgi:iron complex outermembrane recepter protein